MKTVIATLKEQISQQKGYIENLKVQSDDLWKSIPNSDDRKAIADSLGKLLERSHEAEKILFYLRSALYSTLLAYGVKEGKVDSSCPEEYNA